MAAPRPQVRPAIRVAVYASLVFFVFVVCAGALPPGADLIFYLVAGWGWFIARVAPRVHVRVDLVSYALLYATSLAVGAHYFLRWLHREVSGPAGTPWRWRWTLSGLLIVLLMFTAGMATIGVAHQTAWLVSSPEPMFHNPRSERANRVKCGSNLRQLGQAIQIYSRDHQGRFPHDLSELIVALDGDLSASVLVCPSSNDEPAPGPTTRQVAENVRDPRHCSYVYLGAGLVDPVKDRRVIAYEALENHQRAGMNVLYSDFTVDWIEGREAAGLIERLRLAAAATKPTTAP